MRRSRWAAFRAFGVSALLVMGCSPAIPTGSLSTSPIAANPTGTPTAPQTVNPTEQPSGPQAWVTDQDGLHVVLTPSADAIDAGQVVTFTVTLTNERATPLQFRRRGCFAFAYVGTPTPLVPIGRNDWTGGAATFKQRALTGGPPQHVYIEAAATEVVLENRDCPNQDGITTPLAPGATMQATFEWRGSFGTELPDLPPLVGVRALVLYSNAPTLVTVPPPPTSCPCLFFDPAVEELWVDASINVHGATRPLASLGQIIDGALANQMFFSFVETHPIDDCTVDLSLPSDQGRYLPAGPGWNLEEMCEHPRRFIRAEIDPWTAAVKGIDLCVACGR